VAFVLFAGVTPVLAQTQEAGGGPVADPGAAPFAAISTPAVGAIEHEERAPQSVAVRLEGTIDLDGRLDEAAWRAAPAIVDFHQKEPVEGVAPTQRTEVRFLYDGGTLYVGARMFDDEPDRIVGRLVRRDANTNSDEIRITFDTFLDHLGETYFAVNPRGVRCAETWYSAGNTSPARRCSSCGLRTGTRRSGSGLSTSATTADGCSIRRPTTSS
jgi:hypothetical protein